MGKYFYFRNKHCEQVTLTIHPEADFKEILKTLESVQFPDFIDNAENIKYAVLELISNSLRAHREKKISKQITAIFRVKNTKVDVEVKDFGGGFNPRLLPYDLEAGVKDIDQSSRAFEEYRARHKYLRFGMGLLLTKITFPFFEIVFLDDHEHPTKWGGGNVNGTLIRVSTEG